LVGLGLQQTRPHATSCNSTIRFLVVQEGSGFCMAPEFIEVPSTGEPLVFSLRLATQRIGISKAFSYVGALVVILRVHRADLFVAADSPRSCLASFEKDWLGLPFLGNFCEFEDLEARVHGDQPSREALLLRISARFFRGGVSRQDPSLTETFSSSQLFSFCPGPAAIHLADCRLSYTVRSSPSSKKPIREVVFPSAIGLMYERKALQRHFRFPVELR